MHDSALADVTTATTTFREDLRDAVQRHALVVALRPEDDIRRFPCMREHAGLLEALGQLDDAFDFMVSAASYARATGIVFEAASAYVDGALLGQRLGDHDAARVLARRARLLSYSPRLNRKEREAILKRLGELDVRIATPRKTGR